MADFPQMQGHEIQLQQLTQNVRYLQWQHAQETTNGLLKSRDATLERYTYYLRLLNLTPDQATVPPAFTADRRELTEANFADTYSALVGEYDLAFTSAVFYTWMQSDLSALYYQYYRFACDTARKAEQAMKRELMRPELDATQFIQFNYWDSGHQELLSGEALHLDIKRMEMAYHDNNTRELELTRHVSLRQLDPVALLALRTTGSACKAAPSVSRRCWPTAGTRGTPPRRIAVSWITSGPPTPS